MSSIYNFNIDDCREMIKLLTHKGYEINQSAEISLKTTATPFEIFAGEDVLIDTIARGLQIQGNLHIWKDFFNCCTDLFQDETFEAGLVPLLFGIIPVYMFKC